MGKYNSCDLFLPENIHFFITIFVFFFRGGGSDFPPLPARALNDSNLPNMTQNKVSIRITSVRVSRLSATTSIPEQTSKF